MDEGPVVYAEVQHETTLFSFVQQVSKMDQFYIRYKGHGVDVRDYASQITMFPTERNETLDIYTTIGKYLKYCFVLACHFHFCSCPVHCRFCNYKALPAIRYLNKSQ